MGQNDIRTGRDSSCSRRRWRNAIEVRGEAEMELRKPPADPIRLPPRQFVRRYRPRKPTPIPISVTTWRLILLGLVAVLALILWAVPIVPAVALAGFAVALVLSFPVHLFKQYVPSSLAILFSFLILLALLL